MAVKEITRSEYKSKQRNEYAGSRSFLEAETIARWKEVHPDWKGMNWAMWLDPKAGTVLGPVNVVKD